MQLKYTFEGVEKNTALLQGAVQLAQMHQQGLSGHSASPHTLSHNPGIWNCSGKFQASLSPRIGSSKSGTIEQIQNNSLDKLTAGN